MVHNEYIIELPPLNFCASFAVLAMFESYITGAIRHLYEVIIHNSVTSLVLDVHHLAVSELCC